MSLPPTPAVTERDISFQQAKAGISAQQVAQSAGADPADIRALALSVPSRPLVIQGQTLHGFSLQVVLDLQLAATVFDGDPIQALQPVIDKVVEEVGIAPFELLLIARLGWIFTCPAEAYDLLAEAADATEVAERRSAIRYCDRAALEICGEWTADEMGQLIGHILRLGKRDAVETPPTSAPPAA